MSPVDEARSEASTSSPSKVTHDDSGWRRILTASWAFESVQAALGGHGSVTRHVRENVRPTPGMRLLDIGCGPGRLVPYLPPDVQFVGYDMNPAYIATARERYGDRAEFFEGKVGETTPHPDAGTFDVVTANALMHHLSDDDVRELLRAARAHLRPGGAVVTIDPVHAANAPWIARRLVAMDRGRAVRTAEAYRSLLTESFATIESRIVDDMLRVPYVHFVSRCVHEERP